MRLSVPAIAHTARSRARDSLVKIASVLQDASLSTRRRSGVKLHRVRFGASKHCVSICLAVLRRRAAALSITAAVIWLNSPSKRTQR